MPHEIVGLVQERMKPAYEGHSVSGAWTDEALGIEKPRTELDKKKQIS